MSNLSFPTLEAQSFHHTKLINHRTHYIISLPPLQSQVPCFAILFPITFLICFSTVCLRRLRQDSQELRYYSFQKVSTTGLLKHYISWHVSSCTWAPSWSTTCPLHLQILVQCNESDFWTVSADIKMKQDLRNIGLVDCHALVMTPLYCIYKIDRVTRNHHECLTPGRKRYSILWNLFTDLSHFQRVVTCTNDQWMHQNVLSLQENWVPDFQNICDLESSEKTSRQMRTLHWFQAPISIFPEESFHNMKKIESCLPCHWSLNWILLLLWSTLHQHPN